MLQFCRNPMGEEGGGGGGGGRGVRSTDLGALVNQCNFYFPFTAFRPLFITVLYPMSRYITIPVEALLKWYTCTCIYAMYAL